MASQEDSGRELTLKFRFNGDITASQARHFTELVKAEMVFTLNKDEQRWEGDGWGIGKSLVASIELVDLDTEDEPMMALPRKSIEALHFHYTKNGVAESQTAAVALAAALKSFLDSTQDRAD